MSQSDDQEVSTSQSTFEPGWNYKLSPETLAWHRKRAVWLALISGGCGLLLGGLAGGAAAVFPEGANHPLSEIFAIAAVVVFIGGMGGALFWSAYVGGEALRRGGGIVGLLFVIGLIGGAVSLGIGGKSDHPFPWLIASIVCLVLFLASIAGFIVLGWRAGVPMWLQLPIFFSPRLYIRGRGSNPDGATAPDRHDDRHDHHSRHDRRSRHGRHIARDYDD